jgi:hypothetical protein
LNDDKPPRRFKPRSTLRQREGFEFWEVTRREEARDPYDRGHHGRADCGNRHRRPGFGWLEVALTQNAHPIS